MSRMPLSVISEDKNSILNLKTLDLFGQVGVKISHCEALIKLKKAGAVVNEQAGIVKFPRAMVDELLSLAPSVAVETGLTRTKKLRTCNL